MTEIEKLIIDIKNVRETIQRGWRDMAILPVNGEQRNDIVKHIHLCVKDLQDLLSRLDEPNAAGARR